MSEPNLWRASSAEHFAAPALDHDLTVDLAVIGGGFTGLAAALEAARQGASVCVLEAETVGHGGSGRNVGLANAGLWLPPETVVVQMGATAGHRLITALAAAPARVFDLIAREGIACEPTRTGTLHPAHPPIMAPCSTRAPERFSPWPMRAGWPVPRKPQVRKSANTRPFRR